MTSLSLVMPYYKNPMTLARHLQVWRTEWPAEVKSQVEIVIVDDGSPNETAAEVLRDDPGTGLPALSLYRVTEDRLWHQHGARNLGAHVAKADWLLMTDMDHVIPDSTLRDVLWLLPDLHRRDVVTFGRVDAPANTPAWRADRWRKFARTLNRTGGLKPHVNSFVVNRKRYWQLGGYDEDLCGIYGTDNYFRQRLFSGGAPRLHLEHAPLIRVDREVIPDASTRDVERKTPGRAAEKNAVMALKAAEGRSGRTTTLNFPWERVL